MRNLLILIAFSFTYLFAIDCNSMSSVSTFNGHYYAKTNSRTSFDTIRVSAQNDKGYLAIPDSKEENEFIKTLVGGNTEAWIGIFDPNYAKNYCYDNASCFFDDARFRNVKSQVLTYKNWASYEPNNFLENTDIDSLDLVHFGLVKNEMIKRGFLQENITNLNDYNASYLFDNRRASAHVPMTFIALDMPCYDVPFIKQQNLF